MYRSFRSSLILIFLSAALVDCAQKKTDASTVSDSSASGIVAGAVGGALSSSNANGNQAGYQFQTPQSVYASVRRALSPLPQAFASSLCPTFHSTGAACSVSGSSLLLAYQDCTFTGRAEWDGIQAITMSTGTPVCGSFPNPGASATLYRQFVQAGGSPGQLTLTAGGYEGVVDDASVKLANFDNKAVSTIHNGGYGVAVDFASDGSRNQLTIAHRVYVSGLFDHSVTGSLSLTESPGATSRTLNGTVKVYHNLMRVVGTSTLASVVHEDMCCLPVSGTITTVYGTGDNVAPTLLGQLLVGKSEKLTFTGCGTATLENTDGVARNVTLNRCF